MSIPATVASANVPLTAPTVAQLQLAAQGGGTWQCQIYNAAAAEAFIAFGPDNTVTASVPAGATPGDYVVAPGAVIVMTMPVDTQYCAAVLKASTGIVYFSPGDGL